MHWQTSLQVFPQLQASRLMFPDLTMSMTMAMGHLGTLTSAPGLLRMLSSAPNHAVATSSGAQSPSLIMMFAPSFSCPESSPRPSTS